MLVTAAVAIVASVVTFGALAPAGAALAFGSGLFTAVVAAGAVGGFVSGALSTALAGGRIRDILIAGFKSAAIGAVTAAAAYGVGHMIPWGSMQMNGTFDFLIAAKHAAKAALHGLVQGGISAAFGGDFASTALAAFSASVIGSVYGPQTGTFDMGKFFQEFAVTTVAGGAASMLAGGEFANGAVTAAFVFLFNKALEGVRNMTEAFNKQIEKTRVFFAQEARKFNRRGRMPFSMEDMLIKARYEYAKLIRFKDLVKTGAPYDLKAHGWGLNDIGRFSIYNNEIWRYDDYGNYNYGVAARAYGYSLNMAIAAAGIYQIKSGTADWGNPSGWFDDRRDTRIIIRGYNHRFDD